MGERGQWERWRIGEEGEREEVGDDEEESRLRRKDSIQRRKTW